MLSAAGEIAAQYVPSQVKEQAYVLMRECFGVCSYPEYVTDSASKADPTTEPTINEYEPGANTFSAQHDISTDESLQINLRNL